MESCTTIFFASVHSSFTRFAFTIPADGVYIFERLSVVLFCTQDGYIGTIFIFRPKKEPLLLTIIVLLNFIKCRRDDNECIPSRVGDSQCPGHIAISHVESTPIKGETTFPAKRKLKDVFR